jgi:uncharacterized PurR-regulated membrane protein YhhQ (DUF165 family)
MIKNSLKLFKNDGNMLIINLIIFHIFIIAISNYLSTVQLSFLSEQINFFGWQTNFLFVAALLVFPLVVIGNDVTIKLLGKKDAKAVLAYARIPAIIIAVLLLLAVGSPHAYRVGLASIVAYVISTLYDVYVIKFLKEKLQNYTMICTVLVLVSTNIVQSYMFFYTAFYPYIWVHEITFNMTILKILVSSISFIPLYKKLLLCLLGANKG